MTEALYLAVFAAMLVAPAYSLAQVQPAFRAPMIGTPAPISAYVNRLGQGSGVQGPSTSDPEIVELARGLRYDPGLMYKFVHDHIRFTPTWGEAKGAYMTWMDRSGNGFDQATLLIALLTESIGHSEYTIANIQYGIGDIQLTGEQFAAWFGTPNNARIAQQVLARGGFYGAVTANGDQIGSVALVHVWVKASIDGQTHRFDPSFKSHIIKTAVSVPLSAGMGYDRDTFVANAERLGGGWSTANIRADLNTYTSNLVDYIERCRKGDDPNLPDIDDSLEDVIGAKRIEPVEETALPPQTLPYTCLYLPSVERESFGIDGIRNIHRTTLRIEHSGINKTLYSSDIYGRRLSIKYNGLNQPQLLTVE